MMVIKEGGVGGLKIEAGVMVGRADGPEEEGPEEEDGPAEEDVGRI